MIGRVLTFSSPATLSLKYGQLVIALKDREETITRPIEDLGAVIIEHPMVHLSIPLLNALAAANVAVVFCNERFMPCSMLMPLTANSTLQESYRYQIEASQPTRKRLWKKIVEQKIRNQAAVLNRIGFDGNLLKPCYANVLSGDSDNREGAAARIYWRLLMGTSFVRLRDADDLPNTLLNYGYAILRAACVKSLLGSGLFPVFGLFHRNRYNPFPLADDIMEPYRPFVDLLVLELLQDGVEELSPPVKQRLVSLLHTDVRMNDQMRPLQSALTFTTASLLRALKDTQETITLPSLP